MLSRLNLAVDRLALFVADLRALAWCAACTAYLTARERKS